MKKLYQRLAEQGFRPGASAPEPRLTLAAFGKHPGWDDHIPGIGLETETLARLKQVLYVGGIGKQVDSGAWEKLEVDKRLDGFDHTFLWVWPERIVAGLLWSSTDRKGRSKYPMVLCVEGQSVSPGFMMQSVMTGLRRLAESCRATTSADQVNRDCAAAQAELRSLVSSPAVADKAEVPLLPSRQAFLKHPETGPEQLGFLRLLHELGMIPTLLYGRNPGLGIVAGRNSEHLRLPLAGNSTDDALLLWAAFLECAVAETTPLLLMGRAQTPYIEAIVGEPVADDFFCLQTTPAAQPLVTDIPYQLAPDARQHLDAVTGRFLEQSDVEPTSREVPPLIRETKTSGDTRRLEKPRKKTGWLFAVGGLLLVAALIPFVLPSGKKTATGPLASNASAPVPAIPVASNPALDLTNPVAATVERSTTNNGMMAATEVPDRPGEFASLTNAAWAHFTHGDYAAAIADASKAEAIFPEHVVPKEIKRQAELKVAQITLAQQRLKQFQLVSNAASAAFQSRDYSNTIAQCDQALRLETNHPAILELKQQAQARLNAGFAAMARQQEFQNLTNAAWAAYQSQQYSNAIAQVERALRLETNHPAVLELKRMAEAKLSETRAVALQQQFQRLTNAAWASFQAKDYTNAIAQCDQALRLEASHPELVGLKEQARSRLEAAIATAARQKEFQRLTNSAWAALQRQDYTNAIADADRALALETNHIVPTELKQLAQVRLKEAQAAKAREQEISRLTNAAWAAFGAKDYSNTVALSTQLLLLTPDDVGIKQLKTRAEEALRPAVTASSSKAPVSPAQTGSASLEKLDAELEVLQVIFNRLAPEDAHSAEGQKARRIAGSIDGRQRDYYLAKAATLEKEYQKSNWLDRDGRKQKLNDLKRKIEQWP